MDKQWIPTVAGVLEIVAGVCAVLGALAIFFACAVLTWVPDLHEDPEVPVHLITGLVGSLGGLVFLGGVACFIGGVAGIRRRGWLWAMAGAIAAVFLMPPAGVFALVLVILGEKEFAERARAEPSPPASG